MDRLDIILALARGGHTAALLSLLGCLIFQAAVDSPRPGRDGPASTAWIAPASAWAALVLGGVWFGAVAMRITGADGVAALIRAMVSIGTWSGFGHLMSVRLMLLAAVLVLGRRANPWASAAVALAVTAAVAVQPALGHAGAMEGAARAVMIALEMAHLLAAGAWLGGLMPLFLAVRRASSVEAAALCERFTPVGLVATGIIALTALPQAAALTGGLPGLIGTPYGQIILLKTALFLLLLGLAALNRLWLTARLLTAGAARAHRVLIGSIGIEAVLGLTVILAAGLLASSVPGTHARPVWPFPWRPSLAAWQEPELRGELVTLLIAAGFGLGAIGVALVVRRGLLVAGIAAGVLLIRFSPAVTLLFVEAWPTSYAVSPTQFAVESIIQGQALFGRHCAGCHEAQDGKGGGGDLLAAHVWDHWDGELLWRLLHGATDAQGATRMPGFAGVVPEDELWALIDFVRARNAGASFRRTGVWSIPVQAPAMPMACAGADGEIQAGDWPPRLAVVVAGEASSLVPPGMDAATIRLARGSVTAPAPGECMAATPEAWEAWAVLAGVSGDGFAGYRAVVDARGWVRGWLEPGVEADQVAAAVAVARVPLAVEGGGGHRH